jgi:hypothetical protein
MPCPACEALAACTCITPMAPAEAVSLRLLFDFGYLLRPDAPPTHLERFRRAIETCIRKEAA